MNAVADALVVAYRQWAEKIARRRARKLHEVDVEEAVGEALIALVRASRTYDPRLSTFPAWAQRRIEGAVLDAHRRADPAGRHERQCKKLGIETKASRLGIIPRRDGKDVFDLEIAGKLKTGRAPYQEVSVEVMEALAAIRALPPHLADIMERHFFGGENLKVIGSRLGVTESRACQLVQEGRAILAGEATPKKPRAVIETATPKNHIAERIQARAAARSAKRETHEATVAAKPAVAGCPGRVRWLPCGKCGQMGHDGVFHLRRSQRLAPAPT